MFWAIWLEWLKTMHKSICKTTQSIFKKKEKKNAFPVVTTAKQPVKAQTGNFKLYAYNGYF